MCCEEFKHLLDAYIDGELSQAQMSAIDEHAKACEACREELEAARLLKETLAHMDDEIAVPLPAQAAWRNAVRAEAARQRSRKWMRFAYAAAAALVLFFGVNLALDRQAQPQNDLMPGSITADSTEFALVARDGVDETVSAGGSGEMLTVRRKITAPSVQEALDSLAQLAQEYSGSFVAEGDTACRIELPAQYLEDFTKAAGRIGAEIYSETVGSGSEMAVILVQVSAE